MQADLVEYRDDTSGGYYVGVLLTLGQEGILFIRKNGRSGGYEVKFSDCLAPCEKFTKAGQVECAPELERTAIVLIAARHQAEDACDPVWEAANALNTRQRFVD